MVDGSAEGYEGDGDGRAGIEVPGDSIGQGDGEGFELSSADGTGELDLFGGVLEGLDEVLREVLGLRVLAVRSRAPEVWFGAEGRRRRT